MSHGSSLVSQNRSNTRILSSRFNQENSCIAVATTNGFRVLNCDPFSKCYEFNEGGVSLVEMLYHTSLIAFVGAGEHPSFSPRRLRLFNTKTEKNICELNFLSTVLNVKLSYSHLIAVLESKIHIFDTKSMKILHTLDTLPNPRGICALAASNDNAAAATGAVSPSLTLMAYPASEEVGELFIYDCTNLMNQTIIRAHNTPIRHAAFNTQGTLLATCSHTGTVIRVFAIPSGKKLFTFRRGTYPAKINTIAWNRKGDMIVVSSDDSSTVHVFSMRDQPPPADHSASYAPASAASSSASDSSSSGAGSSDNFLVSSATAAGSVFKSVANSSAVTLARGGAKAAAAAGVSGALSFLPNLLQDMVEPSRNFAYINLKDNAIPSVCAFGSDDTLMVVTTRGYFIVYTLPSLSSGGGQCKLESEHSMLDQPSEVIGTKVMEDHAHANGNGHGTNGVVRADSAQRSGFYSAAPLQLSEHAFRGGNEFDERKQR